MRLICPNCLQAVTTADTEAGKTISCPLCSHSFVAPQMYAPPPAPAPAPSPVVVKAAEPAPAAPAAPEPAAAPAPAAPAYSHQHYLLLSRKICAWLAPVCLSIVFLLTFFKWVGFYPAGYSAYSQNAWQALFADISVDPVSEKVFHKEKELNDTLHASWWLLPYLLLLIVSLPFAWADHLLQASPAKLPTQLAGLWRRRHELVAICAGFTLFFLLIQCAAGFGLTHALTRNSEEQFKDELEKAKTPEEVQMVEMRIAGKKAEFYPGATIWLRLTVVLQILAVAGMAGESLLIHRGDKPPPRVGVMW